MNQRTAESGQPLGERTPQQTVTNSQQNRAISSQDPTVVSIPTGTNFSQQMIDTNQQTGAAMNQPNTESEQPLSESTPQQNVSISHQNRTDESSVRGTNISRQMLDPC